MPVVYTGVVPDPFRDGREVIVTGRLKNGTFVAERDSLVTKCPSKFTKKQPDSASVAELRWPTSGPPASPSACSPPLYAVGAALYGARSGRPPVGRLRAAARSTAWPG